MEDADGAPNFLRTYFRALMTPTEPHPEEHYAGLDPGDPPPVAGAEQLSRPQLERDYAEMTEYVGGGARLSECRCRETSARVELGRGARPDTLKRSEIPERPRRACRLGTSPCAGAAAPRTGRAVGPRLHLDAGHVRGHEKGAGGGALGAGAARHSPRPYSH